MSDTDQIYKMLFDQQKEISDLKIKVEKITNAFEEVRREQETPIKGEKILSFKGVKLLSKKRIFYLIILTCFLFLLPLLFSFLGKVASSTLKDIMTAQEVIKDTIPPSK